MIREMKDIIQMFIDNGREGDAFAESARWGEFEILKDMLARGIPIDGKAGNGATALMHAASGGQTRIVEYLLKHGADPNISADDHWRTALMSCLAALHKEGKYLAILQLLLDAGADPNLRDREGRTALDYAQERNSEKVSCLLKSKMAGTDKRDV